MKAQSKVYIQLQNIYKAKARKDAAEILEIVQAAPGGEHVDPAEVDLFCKNAAFVKLINPTGRGSNGEISRAGRLRSAAGKQKPIPPAPLFRRSRSSWAPMLSRPHGIRRDKQARKGTERGSKRAGKREKAREGKEKANRVIDFATPHT